MHIDVQDTIVAIATPNGYGGIAIVRASGGLAVHIRESIFKPAQKKPLKPRYMHYGTAFDKMGIMLDEVLAVFMPGPHSATGEDVLEIHCHGGKGVANAILEAMVEAGARPAFAGEFTRRAFLHGKIDLTQAEAVAEIIHASGKEGVRLASAKLSGVFGHNIRTVRKGLDTLRSQVILAVDFPDEDVEVLDMTYFAKVVKDSLQAIDALLLAYERARLWREGAKVVLLGCVNAGKSSLFNTLLGRYRAIVSPIPGTTRDYLEESINLQGLAVRLLDTAGLREGQDAIEEEGILLSHTLAADADTLVLVVDACKEDMVEEQAFFEQYKNTIASNKLIVVYNKIDVCTTISSLQKTEAHKPWDTIPSYKVSARTGEGLDAFCAGLYTLLCAQQATQLEVAASDVAPNMRQSMCLQEAKKALSALQGDILASLPADILGVHLDVALYALDEVTGTTSNEELLNEIFATFCIGK